MKKKIYRIFFSVFMLLMNKFSFAQPIANCQSVTVYLQRISYSEFEASVSAADINLNSSSPVGIHRMFISAGDTVFHYNPPFGPNIFGPHLVELSVVDNNGITAVCTTTVNVFIASGITRVSKKRQRTQHV